MRNSSGVIFQALCIGIILCLVMAGGVALAQTTTRVSVNSDGSQGNQRSQEPVVSANGRYVVYRSAASNLVAGDTNGELDIFIHDRQTGQTRRASLGSGGNQGNGQSGGRAAVSNDGQLVAFQSSAPNMVTGDTNGHMDVFLHDLQTGLTYRLSESGAGTQGNQVSDSPSMSGDGRYIAFHSRASNLVQGDTNGVTDVFIYDRQSAFPFRVSKNTNGNQGNDRSYSPSISADGAYVAFSSVASNLVADDTNLFADVFVHNRATAQTSRVSLDSAGNQGNGSSGPASISGDGRYVVFESQASNLVAGDTNGTTDIFLHDRQTGVTTRVSLDSAGNQLSSASQRPVISANGQYAAFITAAPLIPEDTNGTWDVYVRNLATGQLRRVSVSTGGNQSNGASDYPSINEDGTVVAFESSARNLVANDTNDSTDIFVYDQLGVPPPPTMLAATRPKANAVNVPRRDPIVVTFAQPVVMGSAEPRFSVIPGGAAVGSAQAATPVTGKIDWLRAFTTLRFTPDLPLPALSPVTVNLAAGIRRKDGTIINFAENFSFTTSGEPVVTAWGPKGDTVGTGAAIRVTFDQIMHRVSVQKNLSSQPKITGTYAWVGKSLTFTPDTPLTPGTKYRVVVGRKSRSATGDEMGRSWVWEFTTAGAPPAPPSAVSVVAAATSNGAAVTVNLSAAANVQVQVLNIAGRSVATLPEQSLPQGLSTLSWNGLTTLGTKAPAGTYLVRVIARNAEGTQCQALTTLSLQR